MFVLSRKYLAYRLVQFFHPSVGPGPAKLDRDSFRPEAFNPREKHLLRTYPTALEDAVTLRHGAAGETRYLAGGNGNLVDCWRADTLPVYVLQLPHCTQVSEIYRERFRQLGGRIPRDSVFYEEDYPLAAFLEERLRAYTHVTMLNPLAAMRQAEAHGLRLFYANDPHLSADGQRWLGEWSRGKVEKMMR